MNTFLSYNPSLIDNFDELFSFPDNISCQFTCLATPNVFSCMYYSCWYERDFASFKCYGLLALNLILENAFNNINDLFTWMPVVSK